MPIEFSTCLERDLLYARWTGIIGMQEFLGNFEAYVSDRHYRPGRPELVDLSRMTDFDGGFNTFSAALRVVNNQEPGTIVHTRTVLWAPNDSIYGLGRMYQQLADLAGGIEVEIYRTEAGALGALMLPYETIDSLLASETFHPASRNDGPPKATCA
ncbi:hypothetical protein HKCCE2091_16090 [Rhodobacterales bacterium HKCCE2091]|nr:hypothetical protein [Rhodobacterales bacterium HKCCE2091]